MKITNTGNKIVNIDAKSILPGESMDIADTFSSNPVLALLAKKGAISVLKKPAQKDDAAKKAAEEAAKAEAEAKAKEAADKKAAAEAAKGSGEPK